MTLYLATDRQAGGRAPAFSNGRRHTHKAPRNGETPDDEGTDLVTHERDILCIDKGTTTNPRRGE